MAGNGTAFLQVSEFSLGGIDVTNRKTIVEGPVLFAVAPSSLLTLAIAAGGTGWAANDEFTIPSIPGAIGKVATVSSGVAATVTIVANGAGGVAGTGVATAAISPSTGTGLTVTTTVNPNTVVQITGWSITSNVLTLTGNNFLTTGGGQSFTIQNAPAPVSFLNGNYTTSSATSTTVVVPLTHANGSGNQQMIGAVQPTYTTGGVPLSWFLDLVGNPNPIGTIGPLSVPTWLEVQTQSGSALNYKVNLTTTPPTLLVFNGVTQLSDQASITVDTAVFRAEFIKNSF
jgi:hypothetical protein